MNNRKKVKKVLVVLVLVFMTFMATACDLLPPNNSGGGSVYTPPNNGSNRPPTPKEEEPKDSFPAIPVHKQTKPISDAEILGSNFFSNKDDYFNMGSNTRFVNLKDHKTVYIRYEQDLDSEVKKTLDHVIAYLQDVFKFDSSYTIVYASGTPAFIGDLFTFDTIYIKNPDKKVAEDFKKNNAAALTYRSSTNSPVVYVNKSVFDVFINGKNIKMARALLHEIMHGFGFNHTIGSTDLLAALQLHIDKASNGKYFYRESGSKTRIFIDDYLFFSNDEIASLIHYLHPNKSYSEKLSSYKKAGGTIPDLSSKFEEMKSSFLTYTRTQKVSTKSPDILLENQIVSMKDKTNTYEIIINKNSIGSYIAILSDGTSFTGRSKIMRVSGSDLTYQIIALTDFKYDGQTRDITLYAIRNKSGDFYQRWKAYNENVNLSFADNTAKHFG